MGCRNILPYSNGEVIIEGMFNNTLIIKEYVYYSSQIFLLNNMGKCRNKKEEKQAILLFLASLFLILAIHEDRYRTIVDESALHVGTENACFYRLPESGRKFRTELFVKWHRYVGLGSLDI